MTECLSVFEVEINKEVLPHKSQLLRFAYYIT